MPGFAWIYVRLHGKTLFVAATASFVILLCALLASTLVVREDVSSLIPTSPQSLAEQFTVLRAAPFTQGVSIAVGGSEPVAAAKKLTDSLRDHGFPLVLTGMGTQLTPNMLTDLCTAVPSLMEQDALASLPDFLDEKTMAHALERDTALLLSPQGMLLRRLVAMDPLGICRSSLRRLLPEARNFGPRMEQGQLMDADGRYALVFAEPAQAMTDSSAARSVMDAVRAAVSALPDATESIVAGGHRHTEENADCIRRDVARIVPLSLSLLVLAYLIFIRTWRGLCVVLLPTACAIIASACTGIAFGGLSGIVVGFGSVVLGITADYAIHVFFALRGSADPAAALEKVSGPLLFGAATTLAAFVVFFSSSIPSIAQMAFFAACGIIAALALALIVMPQFLGADSGTSRQASVARFTTNIRKRLLLGIWIALVGGLVLLLFRIEINGDIRALSYTSAELRHDEDRMREIWGNQRGHGMFAVRGDSVEQALEKNYYLWQELRRLPDVDPAHFTGLASILPALSVQKERQAQWRRFWDANRDAALERLQRHAALAGFAASAFLPFEHWIDTALVPDISPDTFIGLGVTLPLLLVRQDQEQTLVYTLTRDYSPSSAFLDSLKKYDAIYASGETFRAAVATATRVDLLRFSGLALLAVLGMSLFVLRSPFRAGLSLLPVGAGLCATLLASRLWGLELNIFHAMALPLVISLGVDYGIFMLAFLEGRLDKNCQTAVLLSGITTLSGFGSLILAEHPTLFSLGSAVLVGLGTALCTALCVLPLLVEKTATAEAADA